MGRRTTIFVGGLSLSTRAKDVAYEFEKYGRLVRCDIPTPGGRSRGYSFVEFEDEKDAEDAFSAMKDRRIDGREISLQWAKRSPARSWRGLNDFNSRDKDRERERRRSKSRSVSPRRRSRDRETTGKRERSRDRADEKEGTKRTRRSRSRSRERSPEKRRSPSPVKREEKSPPKERSHRSRDGKSPPPRSPEAGSD